MSPLRRSINLILAILMAGGGTSALAYLLFAAAGWRGWMLTAAFCVAWLGFYWVWIDYIKAEPVDKQ